MITEPPEERTGFCDIHHHLLYGVDDGPKTYEEMVEMLLEAHHNGINTIVATPHVRPGISPIPYELIKQRIKEAQEYCDKSGFDIRILRGAEILYTPALVNEAMKKCLPTLADTCFVLVEFAPGIPFKEMEKVVSMLSEYRYQPIIAHVERYRCFLRSPWLMNRLNQYPEVHFQINCESILGKTGMAAKRLSHWMLRREKIDFIASDAHNTTTRKCLFLETYCMLKEMVDERYIHYMMKREMFSGNSVNCLRPAGRI